MKRATCIATLLGLLVPLCIASTAFAQQKGAAPLFFRETWKPSPGTGKTCVE